MGFFRLKGCWTTLPSALREARLSFYDNLRRFVLLGVWSQPELAFASEPLSGMRLSHPSRYRRCRKERSETCLSRPPPSHRISRATIFLRGRARFHSWV